MRENEQDFTRYDRIRFSEAGDRFDPFTVATINPKNCYIGDGSYLGFGLGGHKKSMAANSHQSGYFPK